MCWGWAEWAERCWGLRAGISSPGSRRHSGCCRAKSCSWLGCGLKDAAFLLLVFKVFWKTALLLLPDTSSMRSSCLFWGWSCHPQLDTELVKGREKCYGCVRGKNKIFPALLCRHFELPWWYRHSLRAVVVNMGLCEMGHGRDEQEEGRAPVALVVGSGLPVWAGSLSSWPPAATARPFSSMTI